ncbi:hypothetical protein BJ973_008209 [Actinoplanes tereljensis]|uniref:Uncharacterized protein n=1 Tax=Paractinoplanes tereljensis TaxID=571912 RepID=A0A919NTA0_9ACTN|nr:hypothetical protein [Actinoplanes tereljensis]GIF24730.1 hypothetical protein Ate02nite_74600 [Actinoplanes tereljensis]
MNDDDYGMTLLEPLRGEPSGQPAIDVPKAIRDGRRLRGRRWWTGGLLAGLVATLVGGSLLLAPGQDDNPHPKPSLPPDPAVPASCTLHELPNGGHRLVHLNGSDAAGRWQVGTADPNAGGTQSPAMIWHDGKLVAQAPTPVRHLVLWDINSSGVAVGSSESGGSTNYPYVYRNGTFHRLKGGTGLAVQINDDGVIVGKLGKYGSEVPVRWASPEAEPEELTRPAGETNLHGIYDLAEDGTAVGSYIGRTTKNYLWRPDGTVRELDTPPLQKPEGGELWVVGLRFGWVYAMFSDINGPDDGLYRQDVRGGAWQRITHNSAAAQYGVSAPATMGAMLSPVPVVVIGSRTVDLPSGPLTGTGPVIFGLNGVSADARVVSGNAVRTDTSNPSAPEQPVIWRCE